MKLEDKELEIRPATRKELYSITVMTKKFFPYTGFSMDAILKRLQDPRIHYLVALYKGHTVGFVDFKENRQSVKLMGLAVLEEFRGNGIGEKLLEKAVAFARGKKKEEMILLVSESNPAALKLYAKHGFAKRGRLGKKLWGQEVLLYSKRLQG